MLPAEHAHRPLCDGIRCRLEDAGYVVTKERPLPNGWRPDLVVTRGERTFLVEIKRWHGEANNGIAQLIRYGKYYPEATLVLAIPSGCGSERAAVLCEAAGVSLWLFNEQSTYQREERYWKNRVYAPRHVRIRQQIESIKEAA